MSQTRNSFTTKFYALNYIEKKQSQSAPTTKKADIEENQLCNQKSLKKYRAIGQDGKNFHIMIIDH